MPTITKTGTRTAKNISMSSSVRMMLRKLAEHDNRSESNLIEHLIRVRYTEVFPKSKGHTQ